jgi:tetratricopeptide (TPR) repeat protein
LSGTRNTLLIFSLLLTLLLPAGICSSPAAAAEHPQRKRAAALAEEARQDRKLGDLYAGQDRHDEAIAAYRAAAAADPSLEPELRKPLGAQLLWADRAGEAIPLLASVAANHPHDVEAKRLLALAYRWNDRLADAERLYREMLTRDPEDTDARKGLAESLLWQDRFRAAIPEYERVLAAHPDDVEALTGLSRAWLSLDLPDKAAVYSDRAVSSAPRNADARAQDTRVRERLSGGVDVEASASRDSDDLSIFELTLSTRAHPARGTTLAAAARQLFFRQDAPGTGANIGGEDSVDGTGGSISVVRRNSAAIEWRAGAGITRYDAAGFHPWSGHVGITLTPVDTVRFDFDWERSHSDSILSFQNRVTEDTVALSASKEFRWKTEFGVSAAFLLHHNENDTGQDRENRGERFSAEVSRRLYQKGDAARVTGTVRLGWLGFSRDLDVGVYDPLRYTTEVAGVDWEWRFLPRWVFRGTITAGAQQEKGAKSGPTYSAEAWVDRKAGRGALSVEGFSFDSNARGQGEGFHRYGGLVRLQIPF